MRSFSLLPENTQQKNDWKLRIKRATNKCRFTWKMALKMSCVCVCVCTVGTLVFSCKWPHTSHGNYNVGTDLFFELMTIAEEDIPISNKLRLNRGRFVFDNSTAEK